MTTEIEPIAKCVCGRLFTPMEWAELSTATMYGESMSRYCPCGLNAVRMSPITIGDIKRNYKQMLEEIGRESNDVTRGEDDDE